MTSDLNPQNEPNSWKDYARVALPAIGLVLIAAVFFLWARDLFGDEAPVDPIGSASPVAQIATVPPPTPTATVEVNLETTEESSADANSNGTPSSERATEAPECDSDFSKADKVVVSEDEVRMRSEPDTTQDNVVETLNLGTELTIVGNCFVEDDEGNVFWQVRNEATTNTGYVAEAFLAFPAEAE